MKVFGIFLCIAIAHVLGDLKRGKTGKEDFKVNEHIGDVVSPISFGEVKITSNIVKNLGKKDAENDNVVHTLTPFADVESCAKKTSESLSSFATPWNATPGSSNPIKNWEMTSPETPDKHFQMLWKHSHSNLFMRPEILKEISAEFLENFLGISEAGDLISPFESNNHILAAIPANRIETSRDQIIVPIESEELLLDKYAKSNIFPCDVLPHQMAAETEERDILTRNSIELQESIKEFFQPPSPAPIEYEALMRDELASAVVSVLMDSVQARPLECRPTKHTETEQSENLKAFQDVDVTKSSEAEELTSEEEADSQTAATSYSVMLYILGEVPSSLAGKIRITNAAEDKLLEFYAKYESVPEEFLAAYSWAKSEERQLLKRLLPEATLYAYEVVNAYKALRKGQAWTYVKMDRRFRTFFNEPSAVLREYQTLKRDERDSIDAFLGVPKPTKHVEERNYEYETPEKATERTNNNRRLRLTLMFSLFLQATIDVGLLVSNAKEIAQWYRRLMRPKAAPPVGVPSNPVKKAPAPPGSVCHASMTTALDTNEQSLPTQ